MELLPAIVEALGLGIWTAVQPCPMATNIAAISYLGRRADSPRWVLLAGLLYALGQALVYVILTIVLLGSLHPLACRFSFKPTEIGSSDLCSCCWECFSWS